VIRLPAFRLPAATRSRTSKIAAATPLRGACRPSPWPCATNKPSSIPPEGKETPGEGGGGVAAMSPIWVFGYGSLIWNPGFAYDARLVGFVRDYRRVFYQGNLHTPACNPSVFTAAPSNYSSFVWRPVDGQGARTTGARRSSPEGPSRSSTSPERPAYALSLVHPPPLLL